jgi:hypothetical protein
MKDQSTSLDCNEANPPRSSPDLSSALPRQSSSTAQAPGLNHLRDSLSPAHLFPKSGTSGQASGILISSPSESTANLLTSLGHSTGIDADSIADSTLVSGSDTYPVGLHFREGSGNARKAKASVRADVLRAHEEHLLSPLHSPHTYPPTQGAISSEQAANFRGHSPIAAPTVFSRHAAPLSLPQLDEYISFLTPPAFASPSRAEAGVNKDMFVPLDRLAATGQSIESLEMNYKPKPSWRNCSTILSGLVSIVLGITVSGLRSVACALLDAS